MCSVWSTAGTLAHARPLLATLDSTLEVKNVLVGPQLKVCALYITLYNVLYSECPSLEDNT